ncbi:hypothetical protein OHD62_31005 [Mesorhizobium sp. YC-39]|uniref:hypothetical protein n=1 Tax=unclassified Mesorhizobium TaxID=325217 RepID=UPI0021E88FB7|nr:MULTISPECIES: hypothetical protein [unclassified Mesorhizobium]MCV3211095.1 hypothetical protein [Mesorhizobium sp. YC-2]MCV3232820.1 hypothetical protein [Mesorhizobium sp. YC-39]
MLADIVTVERRFARSARLDADLSGTPPLTGYVLQGSVQKSLLSMVAAIAEGGQSAFTWTGPYGGGKSSAALLLASLVGGSDEQRKLASKITGPEMSARVRAAFPERGKGWRVVALTGRRADLRLDLAQECAGILRWNKSVRELVASDPRALIDRIVQDAQQGGIVLLLDELGKFLEHAIGDGGDVHFLQDLAERAARAGGQLIVVGILHQSFEQYASKLNRSARDEWAKVQGRFQNIPFVSLPDEVAGLLSNAIKTATVPLAASEIAQKVAEIVGQRRQTDVPALTKVLTGAWPLHPVTTLLLGPVSRQRFAQNERSVFGFISSSEPFGFQAHLHGTPTNSPNPWFRPDLLWDYLIANMGSAIAAGNDGAQMALAMEAIERAGLRSDLAARLTKTIALIEFFRNGSGVVASPEMLGLCVASDEKAVLAETLDDLVSKAILLRQPRLGTFALFSGSDFDLDESLQRASERLSPDQLRDLPARLGLRPVPAKRHYFTTGALRTFDIVLQLGEEVPQNPRPWADAMADGLHRDARRSSGTLVLLIPDAHSFEARPAVAAKALGQALEARGVTAAVAVTKSAFLLREHAGELFAIDRVEATHPQLEGDRIARRELAARRAQVTELVRRKLLDALGNADWWCLGEPAKALHGKSANVVASHLADLAFESAPVLQSELLYRDKPSTSAMAALRILMHAMTKRGSDPDLGIEGYPAERGLYITVLQPFGLHRIAQGGVWAFSDPDDTGRGATLKPAWEVLRSQKSLKVSEAYDQWAHRPFGLKRGVMPVLMLAYILAHRANLAVYLNGNYQALVDDLFVDRLLQDPSVVELRRVSRTKAHGEFLRRLASLLSSEQVTVEPDALPVASALFQRFKALPIWSQRTTSLDKKARDVRDVVLKANDPEALLFSEIEAVLPHEPDRAASVYEALLSAETLYPDMLKRLREAVGRVLSVDPGTFEGIIDRAHTAAGVSADLRLDAFAMRAAAFESGDGDIEGLASLLVHKPARNWSDRDFQQALFELAKLARRFKEAEVFAGVKGRTPTAQAISMMVGLPSQERPLHRTFEVTAVELAKAHRIADALVRTIKNEKVASSVELAVLARVMERLSEDAG